MWSQSGELGETDYDDCIHPGAWLTCINMSVSPPIKWNVFYTSANVTEVQRQYNGVCSVHSVHQIKTGLPKTILSQNGWTALM